MSRCVPVSQNPKQTGAGIRTPAPVSARWLTDRPPAPPTAQQNLENNGFCRLGLVACCWVSLLFSLCCCCCCCCCRCCCCCCCLLLLLLFVCLFVVVVVAAAALLVFSPPHGAAALLVFSLPRGAAPLVVLSLLCVATGVLVVCGCLRCCVRLFLLLASPGCERHAFCCHALVLSGDQLASWCNG